MLFSFIYLAFVSLLKLLVGSPPAHAQSRRAPFAGCSLALA